MVQVAAGPPGGSVVARLAADLTCELDGLTEQLVTSLRETDESYLPVDIADLRRTVHANLHSFLTDLASQSTPSTASSRDTARRRAVQGVPLGSVLHAYRLGFQVIWTALAGRALQEGQSCLDGLVRESTTVWSWVDTSSEAVNLEYNEALIESARHDEQRRVLLLDALLEGRLGEWKLLGGSLHAIGLPEHGPYLAVSAETREAGIENLRAAGQQLRRHGVASAWRLRPDEQVGLIAMNRALPFHAIRESLAKEATGRVGVSPQFADALDACRSLEIAAVARRGLSPFGGSGNRGGRKPRAGWGSALSSPPPSPHAGRWRSRPSPAAASRRAAPALPPSTTIRWRRSWRARRTSRAAWSATFSAGSSIFPPPSGNSCWAPCGRGWIAAVTPQPRRESCTAIAIPSATGCSGLRS